MVWLSQKQLTKNPSCDTIHKRILLHPVSILVLLIAGVLIVGLTVLGSADSYNVTATVPAAQLTQAAIISSPSDGAVITNLPLVVTGTCPVNSYVDLIRDGAFSGVATCTANQTFSITTDLSLGANHLQAQDYNITNQAGPVSAAITVNYQPPVTPTNPTSPSKNIYPGANVPSAVAVPGYDNSGHGSLVLSSQYSYESFEVGHEYNWGLDVSGGTPPYFVTINWGDNSSSSLVFTQDPTFNISHNYKTPGNYTISAQTVDAEGVKVVLQLTAVIKIRDIASTTQGVVSSINPPSATSNIVTNSKPWLRFIWPTYAVVMLMVVSFWLGERKEYNSLFKRHRPKFR